MTRSVRPHIVVAGYGGWIKAEVNPAASILEVLKQCKWHNCDPAFIQVPVESDTLSALLETLLLEHRPDIWIGLGVAVKSPAIRVETVGLNIRHFDVPDNRGHKAALSPIIKGGPLAYASDLPNKSIVTTLRDAGIPAALSFHAGTHLCNQMLYSVRHLIRKHGLKTLSGFIHVPQSSGNAASENIEDPGCSMSMEMMAKAIKTVLECAAERHIADRVATA